MASCGFGSGVSTWRKAFDDYKAGVNLVNDGWYLTVKYYERTPPLAIDIFVLDESSDMIIDAEGVIFTGPSLDQQQHHFLCD